MKAEGYNFNYSISRLASKSKRRLSAINFVPIKELVFIYGVNLFLQNTEAPVVFGTARLVQAGVRAEKQ